jgi:hypothetical protein
VSTQPRRADPGKSYRRADDALAEHMDSCPDCWGGGTGCTVGDHLADKEFRTFKAWEGDDPATARAYADRLAPR